MFQRVRRYFSSRDIQPRVIQSEVKNLEVMLEQYYNGPVQLISEEISQVTVPAASPNRLELKLKIRLKNGKSERINVFVKLFDQDDKVDLRIDLLVRFKKEIEAYKTAIPVLTQFQRDYGVSEDKLYEKLFPKCIATRMSMLDATKQIPDNTAAIVLENLSTQGYLLEDISEGFDFSTSKLAVETLASFHAVPLALRILNLDIFREKITSSMVEVKDFEKRSDYYKLIDEFIQFGIQDHPELAEFSEAIDGALDFSKFNSWFRKSYSDQTWVTMCHARYWILNIMIKRNERKKPVACKIVDLQKFEYLPCCIDLAFFMFTSVRKETLEISFEDILKAYFDAFTKTIDNYKIFVSPYNYDNFVEEFDIQGPKILIEILEGLRYIACEGFDMDGEPVLGQKYRRRVRDTLLLMIKRGWID